MLELDYHLEDESYLINSCIYHEIKNRNNYADYKYVENYYAKKIQESILDSSYGYFEQFNLINKFQNLVKEVIPKNTDFSNEHINYVLSLVSIGYPIHNSEQICEGKVMDKNKKRKKDLLEKIKNSTKDFATNINDIDSEKFIDYCERRYKMSTEEFIKWYEENDHEGNADMKLWSILTQK